MRLSLDALWTAVAVVLPALVALLVPMPAVDLAYQVRAGNEILATGAIPRVDSWTFTVWGSAWLDQQWLAQVLLAIGHGAGGWELLAVVRAGLVALTTGLLVATARVIGVGARTAAILALAAFAIMAPALALRPQLFGIVLFAALQLLVVTRYRWPAAFVLSPLLMVVWANVHGSFVLGPVLLGYAWLDDLIARRPGARRSLWVLVIGTLATVANPFLFQAWTYAAGIGANAAIAGRVSEWQRTSPLEMPGLLFYPSVVVTFALLFAARRSIRWPAWLLAVAMAAIGAWAVRGVAWWAIVMVLLIAVALVVRRADAASDATAPARPRRRSLLNSVVVGLLVVVLVAALPWWRPADPLTGRAGLLSYAPSGLAAAVAERVQDGDRLVVPQTWASFVQWAAPEPLVFIDSRFELYPSQVWADYDRLRTDQAGEVLDRWQVDAMVVPAGATPPAGVWELAYEDADGALYLRH